MKKKIKFLMLAVMLITVVTGCGMKSNYSIDITKDKDISFGAIIAMDDDLINTMLSWGTTSDEEEMDEEEFNMEEFDDESEESDDTDLSNLFSGLGENTQTFTDEEQWEYLEETILSGFDETVKYEKYEEGKYKGYKITAFTGKIDDYTSKTDERIDILNVTDDLSNNASLFTKKGNKYVSNMKFDISKDEDYAGMSDYTSTMDLYEVKLIVNLPTKASSNNADEVTNSGKTLTWDLTKDAKNIEFTFSFDGSSDNMMLYFIAGGVAVVVIIGAVVVLSSKNKEKIVA